MAQGTYPGLGPVSKHPWMIFFPESFTIPENLGMIAIANTHPELRQWRHHVSSDL
jgi:hypothetical protein